MEDFAAAWEHRAQTDPIKAINGVPGQEAYAITGLIDSASLLHTMMKTYGSFQFSGLSVLEYGCGMGRMTKWLQNFFGLLHATDISATMLSNNAYADKRIPYNDLGFRGYTGIFDAVFSFAVLMHCRKGTVRNLFKDFNRMLKPGGHIFFQLPIYAKGCETETHDGVAIWTMEEVYALAEAGFEVCRTCANEMEMGNKVGGNHFAFHVFRKSK